MLLNSERHHDKASFLLVCGLKLALTDKAILAKRHELYTKAQKKNPNRWSKGIRNWEEIGDVKLNPENKKEAA